MLLQNQILPKRRAALTILAGRGMIAFRDRIGGHRHPDRASKRKICSDYDDVGLLSYVYVGAVLNHG